MDTGSVALRRGFRAHERHCCRAVSGARAAGGPPRRVGLSLATWGPVIASTGTRRSRRRTQLPSRQFPRSLSVVRLRASVDVGVPEIRGFCGVDRLQITRHRRSENPSAVTAKTPKFGLEITADIACRTTAELSPSVTRRLSGLRRRSEPLRRRHRLLPGLTSAIMLVCGW